MQPLDHATSWPTPAKTELHEYSVKTEPLHTVPQFCNLHEALVCFTWILTSGFQTNGGGVSGVMQFMGMSVAGGDTGREEGEAPVSISPHPWQCPAPPHNLTNIKSRHGTRTPPISSAVRAPLSAQCILQGFLLLLSLSLSGRWLLAPTRSTVIDWHWLGLTLDHPT